MNKAKLIDTISMSLREDGLCRLPFFPKTVACMYYQILDEYVVTVGIETSRYKKEFFTCSFYMSLSFHWGYMLPGMPGKAFSRIGELLTNEDRINLFGTLSGEYADLDLWWNGFSDNNAATFVKSIEVAKYKFIANKKLQSQIAKCGEVKKHHKMLLEVASIVGKSIDPAMYRKYLPQRMNNNISIEWYIASVIVLLNHEPDLITSKYVDLLAIDSWLYANFK